MDRRGFIKGAAAAATVVAAMRGEAGSFTVPKGKKIRSALLHLGMNMWGGYRAPGEAVDKAVDILTRTGLLQETPEDE